jgi:hypothetical protein
LKDWFSLKPAAETMGHIAINRTAAASCESSVGKQCLLKDQVFKKVEILLKRYRMKSSNNKMADSDVVNGIVNDVLKCNHALNTLETLQSIVIEDRESGSKVAKLVADSGIESLSGCEPEFEHRLVYLISDIPGVEARLQCLTFEATFPEAQRKCRQDLEVLHEGMKVLVAKREACRKFFQTALHLGNALNKDRRGLVASRGFQLASLPKLLQLKSTENPKASLFHVVLSLMEPPEVKKLAEKVSVLAAARDRKCSGVSERCQELLSGLLKVEQQAKAVKKQRRKPAVSSLHSAGNDKQNDEESLEDDPSDKFHTRMQEFLSQSRSCASHIAQLHQDVFETYWELAVYFEDPNAVYPPPKGDSDGTQDIFQVFHDFAEAVANASKDLSRLGLREAIAEAENQALLAKKATENSGISEEPSDIKNNADATKVCSGSLNLNAPSAVQPRLGRLFGGATPDRASQSRKASPSPSPQIVSNATTLQRLREVRSTNSSGRSASASRQLTLNSVAARRSSCEDDDDGQQSDVSDWENSPRKRVTRAKTAPELVPSRSSRAAIPVGEDRESSVSLGPPPQRAPSFDSRSSSAVQLASTPNSKRASSFAPVRSGNSSPALGPPQNQLIDLEELHTSPMPPCRPPPCLPCSGGKKERNRKSMSAVADRVSKGLVSRYFGGDSSDSSDEEGSMEMEVPGSPRRRRRSMYSRKSSSSPPPGTSRFGGGKPPRKSDSLATELKKEIRRRSLSSRGNPRTPNNKSRLSLAGLTPVAEPGETPISNTTDSDRSRDLQSRTPDMLAVTDPDVLGGLHGAVLRPEAFGSFKPQPRRLNW